MICLVFEAAQPAHARFYRNYVFHVELGKEWPVHLNFAMKVQSF
jgi:hypothetical protein